MPHDLSRREFTKAALALFGCAALPVAAKAVPSPPLNYIATEPPALLFGCPVFIDERQVTIRSDGSWRGFGDRPFDAD